MTQYLHTQKQDTIYHQCTLPGEPWNLLTKFIESGILVRLRRRLKRWTMINKDHPYTRSYAPSLSRIKNEEQLHLIDHYAIIHPLSLFSMYLDFSMCTLLLVQYVIGPIMFAISRDNLQLSLYMMPFNIPFCFFIMINFFTGVYNIRDNEVRMRPMYIVKNYAKTYLILDIVGYTPQLFRTIHRYLPSIVMGYLTPFWIIIRYIRYIWCLRVLKVARLYFGFSTFKFNLIKLTLHLLVINVLAIYILFSAMPREENFSVNTFLMHADATVQMIMMINHGPYLEGVGPVLGPLLSVLFILVGFVFHLVVLVEVMSIWFRYFSAENKQSTVFDSVYAYVTYKGLPIALKNRIRHYLEFKYHGAFYKETAIIKSSTPFLREEMTLAATQNLIESVSLFSYIPDVLKKQLRLGMTTEIFLTDDVIFRVGSKSKIMYFIISGNMLVTSSTDEIICYLRDGDHFGESALLLNMCRVINVIAVTPCEVYKLEKNKFMEVLGSHPDILSKMETELAERILITGHKVLSSNFVF